MRFFLFHRRYGGQLFDVPDELVSEIKSDLYSIGFRENKFEAARVGEEAESADTAAHQAAEAFVRGTLEREPGYLANATDEELANWSKDELEQAARDELGIELDRRKKPENLIRDIREAQHGDRR